MSEDPYIQDEAGPLPVPPPLPELPIPVPPGTPDPTNIGTIEVVVKLTLHINLVYDRSDALSDIKELSETVKILDANATVEAKMSEGLQEFTI